MIIGTCKGCKKLVRHDAIWLHHNCGQMKKSLAHAIEPRREKPIIESAVILQPDGSRWSFTRVE